MAKNLDVATGAAIIVSLLCAGMLAATTFGFLTPYWGKTMWFLGGCAFYGATISTIMWVAVRNMKDDG